VVYSASLLVGVECIAVVSSKKQVGREGGGCHGMESMEAWQLTRSGPGAHCWGTSDGGGWMDWCRIAIAGMKSGIVMAWGWGGHPGGTVASSGVSLGAATGGDMVATLRGGKVSSVAWVG